MDTAVIQERIRSFIVESFLTEKQAQTFTDDEDLLKVLDSLQILRMVMHVEGAFGVKVGDEELTPDNLGSVRKIAELIARKGP